MAAAPLGTVAVAFSGGRDSLALLHATCRSAALLGLDVVALHVHHGLLPQADQWVEQAQALCVRWRRRGWPLRLRWARLSGAPAPGDSVEAWARSGRYAALARLAMEEGASLLLLAQHRRDQAETVLLQALRGGGPAGLSAMPASASRAGLVWARPWLNSPREAIEAYLRRHRLRPLDDPSNRDLSLARNRLRLQVWPALLSAFSDAETALAGAARRAQEATVALAELAALDLAPLLDARARLQVAGWRRLSIARQGNALRTWLAMPPGRGAAHALVQRLLHEVPASGAARWPAGNGLAVVLHRGQLQITAQGAAKGITLPVERRAVGPSTINLSRPGRWPVAEWSGAFEVLPGRAQGLAPASLASVSLRRRSGGERFARTPRGLARSLKKQYQSAGVAEHERGGPLLWSSSGQLLFVPMLGIDARCWAAEGEEQLTLRWCPDRVPSGCDKAGD